MSDEPRRSDRRNMVPFFLATGCTIIAVLIIAQFAQAFGENDGAFAIGGSILLSTVLVLAARWFEMV